MCTAHAGQSFQAMRRAPRGWPVLVACWLAGCSLHEGGFGSGGEQEPSPGTAERGLDGSSPDAQHAGEASAPLEPILGDGGASQVDADDGGLGGEGGARSDLDAQLGMRDGSDALLDAAGEPIDGAAGADAGSSCVLSGSYAALIDLAVTWNPPLPPGGVALLEPGSGHVYLLARLQLETSTATAVLAPCGLMMPDFEGAPAVGGGLFGGDIPATAWEAPTMPTVRGTWSHGCDWAGCSIATEPLQLLLGARPRSSSVAWPAPGAWISSGALDAVDDDNDGRIGVSWLMRGPDRSNAAGRPYAYPPAGLAEYGTGRRLSLALSLRMSLTGALTSCEAASGTVPLAALNISTVGCTAVLRGGTQEVDCPPEIAQLVDAISLPYVVHTGSFQLVRTATVPSCASVRSAFGF